MKNLAKAVIAVMKEVKGMEKNSRVGSGGMAYDGTKDQDVKQVFNTALANHGLCMIPFDIQESTQVDRWEETNQYGAKQKQSVFTKVVVKYNLIHESGESTVVCGYGHGVDPQDKGAGKATTYAMKNALLYTFVTPVGKIDDTETTHSESIQSAPSKPTLKKSLPVPKGERIIVEDGDELFLKIVKAVAEGKATIQQAIDKYSISEVVEDSLKEKIQALTEIV